MRAKGFVDSNIWLYAFIESTDDYRHQQAAGFVLSLSHPVVNSQVIREVCSNLIKKIRMPEDQLRALINRWHPNCGYPMC